MSRELRTLLLDLELTYGIYLAYPSKKPQYLSDKQLIHDQFCTCAAWKWHDEASTYVIKITDNRKRFKANFRDDYIVAVKLHELMTAADIIVAHNGDAFDIKHANTMFRKHGLGPIPEKKSIDTLKAARKYFAFPGNSLDSLAKRFGSTGKNQKPDWAKMTMGDEKEINIAAKYCRNDVIELEKVFVELRPYMRNLVKIRDKKERNHYGIKQCDACGSKRFHSKGLETFNGKPYPRIRCQECGHQMRGDIKLWRLTHS